MYAVKLNHPISAIIVSAALTGCGGGIISDVLAGRKPLVFRKEIYAVWAIIAGLALGSGLFSQAWHLYTLFIFVTLFRVLSYTYNWHLPNKKWVPKI